MDKHSINVIQSWYAKKALAEYKTSGGTEPLELRPLNGQQKSFYKKAQVVYNDELKEATLYSYGAPVLRYSFNDKEFRRLWDGWSATTAQHIKAFVGRYITKAEWIDLGVGLPVFTAQDLCDWRGLQHARHSLEAW